MLSYLLDHIVTLRDVLGAHILYRGCGVPQGQHADALRLAAFDGFEFFRVAGRYAIGVNQDGIFITLCGGGYGKIEGSGKYKCLIDDGKFVVHGGKASAHIHRACGNVRVSIQCGDDFGHTAHLNLAIIVFDVDAHTAFGRGLQSIRYGGAG